MTKVYEGGFSGKGLRVAIVVGRFNEAVCQRLLDGALDCLRRHRVDDHDISIAWVPGAFEIPAAAERFARSEEVDAVVALGAVIRGETAHFDYVAGEASAGIARVTAQTGIPVAFGILTTEDSQQAHDRAGGKVGNKGFDAALAAIEMANLFAALPKSATDL